MEPQELHDQGEASEGHTGSLTKLLRRLEGPCPEKIKYHWPYGLQEQQVKWTEPGLWSWMNDFKHWLCCVAA